MSYIGSSATPLPVNFSAVQSQGFNGTGSQTTFTLNRSVGSAASVEVLVNNVQQSPYDGSYNITGGTSLVFSEAPSAGTNNVYVVYRDQALGSLTDTGAVRKTGDTMTGDLSIAVALPSDTVRPLYLENSAPSGNLNQAVQLSFGNDVGSTASFPSGWIKTINTSGASNASAMQFGGYTGSGQQTHMTIDNAGRLITPYQPSFSARWASRSFVFGVGATVWDQAVHNIGNHYNTSNGRFTAPVAGVYQFSMNCQHYGGTATGGVHDIQINGAFRECRIEHVTGGNFECHSVVMEVYMAVGDYAQCVSSGPAIWWSDHSQFCGYLIG